MSGYLTTHVLDTALGRPARGLTVDLFRLTDANRTLLITAQTNSDGRTERPILSQAHFRAGRYELLFHVGAYFSAQALEAPFLDEVPIRFTMTEPDHYHVPLLLSPYGYSTYRGS